VKCPLVEQPPVSAGRRDDRACEAEEYSFYLLRDGDCPDARPAQLNPRFTHAIWKPRGLEIVPPGTGLLSLGGWWLLHLVHVFRCRDYGVLVIFDGRVLVHRSCVLPKWFRFPFMQLDDLQIASTWTDEGYRGQGIATWAISTILAHYRRPGRSFWYLVRSSNAASIRVVEKAGFRVAGKGSRTRRWGCRLLGCFQMNDPVAVEK
jgi:GNAT superfamily N-acetyltransferase